MEEHNIDGEIFIDRDPTVFHLVLNYLRDDRVIFPDDGHTAALLFQEAKVRFIPYEKRIQFQYYKLDNLVEMISKMSFNASGYKDLKEM